VPVGYGDNPPIGAGGPEPKTNSDKAKHLAKPKAAQGKGKPPANPSDDLPPAGPHDDPALTNPDSTPGTGALPSPGTQDDDIDSTSS
jgi:hypothetical protein